jgi:putative ABC transport system permease protein
MPLMRARVVGVEGSKVNLPTPDAVRKQGRLTREFGITYREELQTNEHLTAGKFWKGSAAAPPDDAVDAEVSISEEVRRDADVGVGDLVRFDVAGQVVRARVTSIRRIAWDETQNGGFFFVLRPGAYLAKVPHTFVGFLQVGSDPAHRSALQRDLVQKFPNVTSIDVRAVVDSIRAILDKITLGITVVGAITLGAGILILAGAVAMTKFQRLYEAAIYRTLGAGTRVLTAMVAVEYGLLGLLAGILGAAGAFGLSWALVEYLFEMRWRPVPGMLAVGALLTAVVVCVVGLAASVDVLMRKPLGTLRRE